MGDTNAEAAVAENEQKASVWRELLSWVEIVVAAILISLFLTRVVLINAEVPSSSMENLIKPDDRLFGNRLAYTFGEPERFDVVIFKYPVDETQNYIKRVIGLPGETVEIRDAKIYIDGSDEPLVENYLPEEWVVENDGLTYTVPEDCYFFCGDNRGGSWDARYWDNPYINKENVKGKARFIFFPFNSIGPVK